MKVGAEIRKVRNEKCLDDRTVVIIHVVIKCSYKSMKEKL